MTSNIKRPHSDAEWYCRKDPETECFYEIFFWLFRKYNVCWTSAGEKERQLIDEITRITYERDKASRLALPLSDVRLRLRFDQIERNI